MYLLLDTMERTRMYFKFCFPHRNHSGAISAVTYESIDILHAIAEFYFPRLMTKTCVTSCRPSIRFSRDEYGETILETRTGRQKTYEIMTHYDGSKRKAELINEAFIRAKCWIDTNPIVNEELLEMMESIFCIRINCSASETRSYKDRHNKKGMYVFYSSRGGEDHPLISLHLAITNDKELERFTFDHNEEEAKNALIKEYDHEYIYHFLYLNQ